ncbi:23S rRNA (guanosine(2251)-2'-O)-methyltransferase RlmB [bacterium]|nr:23S rRNA (guanosine(2251)-2'-O)-methyltransferase RlmB [candidate division CSSED10-310 bacterium]
MQCLDGRRVEKLWILHRLSGVDPFRRLAQDSRKKGIAVSYVSRQALDRMTGSSSHQGLAARLAVIDTLGYEAWRKALPRPGNPALVLVLDQVVDPGNLGNIFRTASAASVHGIMVPKHGTAPFSPAAFKASAGTLDRVPVTRVANISNGMKRLKDEGFWVVGISMEAPTPIFAEPFPERVVLVVGSEGRGIRPMVRKTCDEIRSIPLTGAAGSINVASAVAIVLYEIIRSGAGSSR